MEISKSLYALAIAGACSLSVSAQTMSFNFTESGSDVILTVSGTFGTTGLGVPSGWTRHTSLWYSTVSSIRKPNVVELFGVTSSNTLLDAYYFTSSTTELSGFGTGTGIFTGSQNSSTDAGFFTARWSSFGNNAGAWVARNYTIGSSISAQSTFSGQSLSSMGITPNYSHSFTLGGQSFSVTTVVPEASGSVAGLGLAVVGLYQLRRRRQNTVTE